MNLDLSFLSSSFCLSLVAILLPLLAFVLSFFGDNVPVRKGYLSTAAIVSSFVLSAIVFYKIWNVEVLEISVHWFVIGTLELHWGILLNNLSVLMLLLIAFVASLVHLYSIAYMKGDNNVPRYWSYMGLFCSSMMALVIANNLLQLYIAWELVGFSSYLLIGFWYQRNAAVQANKKAFIMNRIGDVGFLIGIMIILGEFNTLSITELFAEGGLLDTLKTSDPDGFRGLWISVAGLCFFAGAMAKSAQFPLHTWLPDAMEGPTSASSLIHAATMVAAGVFLMVRIFPVFNMDVLLVISSIGAFTAFMASTIALTQNDIKKILAFSTISQLGFMVLAVGIGEPALAVFHLITHAFFKCLLFLAAGSVIHEMSAVKYALKDDKFDPQNILTMGGLGKYMPVTFVSMTIAAAALAGLPFTSGYLSKDAILIGAFDFAKGNGVLNVIPVLAFLSSLLTVFYIGRLIFKVFIAQGAGWMYGAGIVIKEAPALMKYPLVILSVFCLFIGFSFNPFSYDRSWILKGMAFTEGAEGSLMHTVLPLTLGVLSIVILFKAFFMYTRNRTPYLPETNFLYRLSKNQWYFNQLNSLLVVDSVMTLSRLAYWFDTAIIDRFVNAVGAITLFFSVISSWIDKHIIDGIVNGTAYIASLFADFIRHFQSGRLQHYFVTMLLVILAFLFYICFSTLL